MSQQTFDVIIVGAGPTGIFAGYELIEKNPKLRVLIVEQGHDIYHRICPILQKKLTKCPINRKGFAGCYPACSITSGFGGSGAYSDGKFNITHEFGGWLNHYMDDQRVLALIHDVDTINLKHGAPTHITDPTTPAVIDIERRGMAVGLKLLRSQVRHLGTEINIQVLTSIYEHMVKQGVQFLFKTEVDQILVESGSVTGVQLIDGRQLLAPHVVVGVGRGGSSWLKRALERHGVAFTNNRVDIGVRVETNDIVMREINHHLYEGKFIFNTSVGTQVRTFCSNPSGHVVVENHHGVMVCNGHSYNDEKLGSTNTNFALLVSLEFDQPFKNPNDYAIVISGLSNQLSNGGVIVQKYGDFKRGRRSTPKRIQEGFVKPTLKEAVPGDLGLVLPYNVMRSLAEMLEALDHVTPGIANEHTLLYGVEAKFYSDRPEIDKNFQTKIQGLYVGGDGAGLTRGLAQAGANGLAIARAILTRE